MEYVPLAMTFIALVVMNCAAFKLIQLGVSKVDLGSAIAEKDGPPKPDGTPAPATSYSRVIGLVGGMILAAFIWGLGNVVIYTAMTKPEQVAKVLDGVTTFIVGSASLFLPYATNQIREAFNPRNPSKPTA
jgi:hypothetical protein